MLDVVDIELERLDRLGAVESRLAVLTEIGAARGEEVVRELHAVRIAALPLHGGPGNAGVRLHELGDLDIVGEGFGQLQVLAGGGFPGLLQLRIGQQVGAVDQPHGVADMGKAG